MEQQKNHRLAGYGISQGAVRINASNGDICGAGVAISPRHVATCTHVLLDAFGLKERASLPEQESVPLILWLQGSATRVQAFTTSLWHAVEQGDLAVLTLDQDADDLIPACCQALRDDQWSRETVEAFGFPKQFDDTCQWVCLDAHNKIPSGRVQCSPKREGVSEGHSGGSWNLILRDARAAYRNCYPPDYRNVDTGCRVCVLAPLDL